MRTESSKMTAECAWRSFQPTASRSHENHSTPSSLYHRSPQFQLLPAGIPSPFFRLVERVTL